MREIGRGEMGEVGGNRERETAWLRSTERGENSFTAGRGSTFYRNPELEMREKEDYCSLQVTLTLIFTH